MNSCSHHTSHTHMLQGANYNKSLAQNVAAEKVQMYGQAFERIQQATGIDEIDQVSSVKRQS